MTKTPFDCYVKDEYLFVVGDDKMKGCFKLQGTPTEKRINYKRVTIGKEAIEVDEGLEELSGTYIKKPCRNGFYYERTESSPMFIYRKGRKQWWYFNDELDSDVSYL